MNELIKTKSFWTGVAGIVTGIGMIFMGDIATGIQTIGGGIAAIVLRQAITVEAARASKKE